MKLFDFNFHLNLLSYIKIIQQQQKIKPIRETTEKSIGILKLRLFLLS